MTRRPLILLMAIAAFALTPPRLKRRPGLVGVRIGEAKNPGPAKKPAPKAKKTAPRAPPSSETFPFTPTSCSCKLRGGCPHRMQQDIELDREEASRCSAPDVVAFTLLLMPPAKLKELIGVKSFATPLDETSGYNPSSADRKAGKVPRPALGCPVVAKAQLERVGALLPGVTLVHARAVQYPDFPEGFAGLEMVTLGVSWQRAALSLKVDEILGSSTRVKVFIVPKHPPNQTNKLIVSTEWHALDGSSGRRERVLLTVAEGMAGVVRARMKAALGKLEEMQCGIVRKVWGFQSASKQERVQAEKDRRKSIRDALGGRRETIQERCARYSLEKQERAAEAAD
eukprot:gene4022-17567_t